MNIETALTPYEQYQITSQKNQAALQGRQNQASYNLNRSFLDTETQSLGQKLARRRKMGFNELLGQMPLGNMAQGSRRRKESEFEQVAAQSLADLNLQQLGKRVQLDASGLTDSEAALARIMQDNQRAGFVQNAVNAMGIQGGR